MNNKKLINLLIKQKILKHGNFKLRSGITSSYYCDIKEALGYPKILDEIIKQLTSLIPKETTCIVGSGYGGITLASDVSFAKGLPLVLVRDVVKNHGTKKIIDGYLPDKKDHSCIVDDVFTTGSSVLGTKEKLKYTKCKFTKPVVVLNRSTKNSIISILKSENLLS